MFIDYNHIFWVAQNINKIKRHVLCVRRFSMRTNNMWVIQHGSVNYRAKNRWVYHVRVYAACVPPPPSRYWQDNCHEGSHIVIKTNHVQYAFFGTSPLPADPKQITLSLNIFNHLIIYFFWKKMLPNFLKKKK